MTGVLMSRRLTIDFEWMQMAFEDRDGDGAWFLDLETGEVVRLTDDDDELREQIEGSVDRYIGIPYQGSQAGYRDMVEFIGSVDDNRLRALLDTAIQGSGAFRRFKRGANPDLWSAIKEAPNDFIDLSPLSVPQRPKSALRNRPTIDVPTG